MNDEYIIVATNSKNLKVFKVENWNCQIVYGHTDTVLGIDVNAKGDRFLTAGKVIYSRHLLLEFCGAWKKLETAGFRIKNSAIETGSYYGKSGHG